MSETLASNLKKRATMKKKIDKSSARARQCAVLVEGCEDESDFNVIEQVGLHEEMKRELRKNKVAGQTASLNNTISVPDWFPVDESGKEISLFQAVLVRDDMKGYKNLLESLININHGTQPLPAYEIIEGGPTHLVRKRQFDFDKTLELIETLEKAIDHIDGQIQRADHMVEV